MMGSTSRRELVGAGLIGALLVVLLAGVLPAGALSGDDLVLGAFNTSQTDKTTVWSNTNNWGFRIKQARADQAALKLETNGGPPMIVNSTAMVNNLNADLLDGMDGGWYRPIGRSCSDGAGRPPGTDYSCEMEIALNRNGTFYLTGSGKAAGTGVLRCEFLLDGGVVDNSSIETVVDGGAVCASSVAVNVPAGPRTVTFLLDPDAGVGPGGVSAWVLFIPTS
jgi:hypothetical protein